MARQKRTKSYTQQVHEYLEHDVMVQEMMAKGLINMRQTARYLIDELGWECSEEAVVSAMRRWDAPQERLNIADVSRAIRDGSYAYGTGWQGVRLKDYNEVARHVYTLHRRTTSMYGRVTRWIDWLVVNRDGTEIRAFVKSGSLDQLLDGIDEDCIIESWEHVSYAHIYVKGSPTERALAASLLLSRLAYSGVDIIGQFSGRAHFTVCVPGEDDDALFDTLSEFVDGFEEDPT